MTAAVARVAGLIARHGETVELDGVYRTAVVALMPKGQARNLFTDAEATVLPALVWAVLFPASVTALPGQALIWNGRTLQVRRSIEQRWAGEDVARLVVAY